PTSTPRARGLMDWWHVAFDIRPPSAPASSKSSPRKSSPQSGPADPNTPIFSTQLAKTPSRAAKPTVQPAKPAAQPAKPTNTHLAKPTDAQPAKRSAETAKSTAPVAKPASQPAKAAKRPALDAMSAKGSSDADTSRNNVDRGDGPA